MPKLISNNGMQNINTSSNYSFSATTPDNLGATEYTLVTVVVDKSSSLCGFEKDLEKMLQASVSSCQKSPRAENLLLRVVFFNHDDEELHGFKLLSQINISDYDGSIKTSGSTSLYDTTYQTIQATAIYADNLNNQDFLTNAIIFVITDGEDNNSKHSATAVKDLIIKTRKSEVLESFSVVLIGMTGIATVKQSLQNFKNTADLDHYIDMGDVDTSKLAKLAGYISNSISASSKSLGSGSSAQSLSF